jgi:hypothetical protein
MGLRDTGLESFYAGVCEMPDRLGMPRSLADIGVPRDGAAGIAASTNARGAQIETIVETALTRGRQRLAPLAAFQVLVAALAAGLRAA